MPWLNERSFGLNPCAFVMARNVRIEYVYRCVECDKHLSSQWRWHAGMGTNLEGRWLEMTESSFDVQRNVDEPQPDGSVIVTFHMFVYKIRTFAGMRCPNWPTCTSETFDEAPYVRIFPC